VVSDEEIDREIEKIDADGIRKKHDERVEHEMWGGEEIGGVDVMDHPDDFHRQKIQKCLGEGEGHAYKVKLDGETVVFQWHKPHVEGFVPMSEEEAKRHAEEHRKKIVDQLVHKEVLSKISKSVEKEKIGTSVDKV